MLEFTVLGDPRGTRKGPGYTDSETRAYEAKVRRAFLANGGTKTDAPIAVIISAFHRVPKSWSQERQRKALLGDTQATCKPVAANIAKAVLDALNHYAYEDDKQVVSLHVRKAYAVTPRVEVAIMREGENHANG